jgi:hypothetical protein
VLRLGHAKSNQWTNNHAYDSYGYENKLCVNERENHKMETAEFYFLGGKGDDHRFHNDEL